MWRSAARAWISALWPSVRTTAFRCGFIAPICSMCALRISSEEIRPDRIAFASQTADAPITFRRRRRLFAMSDDVARLDVEYLDSRADQLLQLRGSADEGRERAEVHRHDGLHTKKRHRLGGALRPHREKVADR